MESVYKALSLQNQVVNKYSLLLDEIDKKVEECRKISKLPFISKLSLKSDKYTG